MSGIFFLRVFQAYEMLRVGMTTDYIPVRCHRRYTYIRVSDSQRFSVAFAKTSISIQRNKWPCETISTLGYHDLNKEEK